MTQGLGRVELTRRASIFQASSGRLQARKISEPLAVVPYRHGWLLHGPEVPTTRARAANEPLYRHGTLLSGNAPRYLRPLVNPGKS
jgi:hypothetical protein